jgi:hypothetical protein
MPTMKESETAKNFIPKSVSITPNRFEKQELPQRHSIIVVPPHCQLIEKRSSFNS